MEKELLELKFRVMKQRIDKLSSIFELLERKEEANKLKDIIKRYIESYNEILQAGKFDRYKDIENEVIREVAPIELSLDEYIRKTAVKYEEIIEQIIQKIVNSRNYKYFEDLDAILEKIKALKSLIKLYAPYINKEKLQEGLKKASKAKCDVLLKKQALALVYGNKGKNYFFTEYDDEAEKTYFEQFFEQLLLKKFGFMWGIDHHNISVIDNYINGILRNEYCQLGNVIEYEIRRHPEDYIGLLNAKIFNPHLCNIEDNPSEMDRFLEKIEKKGMPDDNEYPVERNRGNFSLLYAVLSRLISDENTSIIECERIYQRFGFRCRPLILNERQRIVKKIFDETKDTEEYKEMLARPEVPKERQKKYCRIEYFCGLIPNFYYDDKINNDYLLMSCNLGFIIMAKRMIREIEEANRKLTRQQRIYSQNNDNNNPMYARHIFYYRTGLSEWIERLSKIIKKLEEQEESDDIQCIRENLILRGRIIVEINQPLWDWDVKKCEFIVPEKKRSDLWRLLPLEDIVENEFEEGKNASIRYIFTRGDSWRDTLPRKSDVWKEYEESFEELGLDIKHYGTIIDNGRTEFQICINLSDIADLPLDEEKLEIVTEEEIARAGEKDEQER